MDFAGARFHRNMISKTVQYVCKNRKKEPFCEGMIKFKNESYDCNSKTFSIDLDNGIIEIKGHNKSCEYFTSNVELEEKLMNSKNNLQFNEMNKGQMNNGQTNNGQTNNGQTKIQTNRIESDPIKSNQIRSNRIESNRIKMNQIKLNQIRLNQIKLNQIKMNQVKMNQIKSNQIKSNQQNLNKRTNKAENNDELNEMIMNFISSLLNLMSYSNNSTYKPIIKERIGRYGKDIESFLSTLNEDQASSSYESSENNYQNSSNKKRRLDQNESTTSCSAPCENSILKASISTNSFKEPESSEPIQSTKSFVESEENLSNSNELQQTGIKTEKEGFDLVEFDDGSLVIYA